MIAITTCKVEERIAGKCQNVVFPDVFSPIENPVNESRPELHMLCRSILTYTRVLFRKELQWVTLFAL